MTDLADCLLKCWSSEHSYLTIGEMRRSFIGTCIKRAQQLQTAGYSFVRTRVLYARCHGTSAIS